MFDRTIHGQIQRIVYEETRYLRHYIGKVVENADPKPTPAGRVKVQIDELGFDTPALAIWCWPRQGHQADVPAVGEWVEVWFIAGEARRPVYLAGVQEVAWQSPLNGFKAPTAVDPGKHTLYQNPKTGDSMTYDEAKQELDILLQTFKIGDGSEAFVKGSTFYTFMQNLMTWISGHTHGAGLYLSAGPGSPVTGTSGGPVSSAPSLSDFRSTKVLGQ
jgi:hypothetical protein